MTRCSRIAATARRAVRFDVRDPGNKLTYAVVSRVLPGGATWSVKLISPQLLATDPLLSGKIGNFLSGLSYSEDSFRLCTNSGGVVVSAVLVDCSLGTNGTDMGANITALPDFGSLLLANVSAGDISFADFLFVAGEEYTFRLYNDDGWKTVNGQAGKTPIATYIQKLERLPYTFAELFGPPPTFIATSPPTKSLTDAQIGAAFTGPTGALLDQTFPGWTALPDARKFGRASVFVFTQGPAAPTPPPGVLPGDSSHRYIFSYFEFSFDCRIAAHDN